MPLYTYIMPHKGETKISQHKHSTHTGFLRTPIAAMVPNLKPAFDDLTWMRLEPVDGAKSTWTCSTQVSGELFTLHVVETRD